MINFPYALDTIPTEQYGAMNAYIESTLNSELLNISQVRDEYKISHQSQYQMIKDNKIPGHFMVGSTHLYLACLAKPWLELYVAKQIARASIKEAKKAEKSKGRGRPKKPKGEFEYELFGSIYKGEGSILQTETQWRLWLRDQYPHYFQPNLNRDGWPVPYFELMNDLEGTLCPDYRVNVAPKIEEINRVFRQLEKAKK